MKSLSNDLKAHLAANLSTLTACVKVTRADSEVFRFTAHNRDLEISGELYQTIQPFVGTAFSQSSGFSVDNTEVVTFVGDIGDNVQQVDVEAREFDLAVVDLFMVNFEDVSMGLLYIAKGWRIGEIEIQDNQLRVEIRGKAQYIQQSVVDLYAPACRVDLGSPECGIDLDDTAGTFRYYGQVESVTLDRKKFIDSGALVHSIPSSEESSEMPIEDVFRFGLLIWTDPSTSAASAAASTLGLNEGYQMEVKEWNTDTGEFELFEAMPYEIQPGDTFLAYFGCDKLPVTCRVRYQNLVNFRGEPFVPGFDVLQRSKVAPRD